MVFTVTFFLLLLFAALTVFFTVVVVVFFSLSLCFGLLQGPGNFNEAFGAGELRGSAQTPAPPAVEAGVGAQ